MMKKILIAAAVACSSVNAAEFQVENLTHQQFHVVNLVPSKPRIKVGNPSEAAVILMKDGVRAGSGTVIVIGESTLMITAAHCVNGSSGYSVSRTMNGDQTRCRLLEKRIGDDLAVFALDRPLPGVEVADSDPPQNSEVSFLGLGGSVELTKKSGRVLGHSRWANSATPFYGAIMLKTSCPCQAGDSGGGVICGGKLVSVNTGGDYGGTFGSSVPKIKAILAAATSSPTPANADGPERAVTNTQVVKGNREPDGDGTGIGDPSKCILVAGRCCDGSLVVPSQEVIDDLRSKGFDVSRLSGSMASGASGRSGYTLDCQGGCQGCPSGSCVNGRCTPRR